MWHFGYAQCPGDCAQCTGGCTQCLVGYAQCDGHVRTSSALSVAEMLSNKFPTSINWSEAGNKE